MIVGRRKFILGSGLGVCLPENTLSAEKFNVIIARKHKSKECVSGYIEVNKKIIGYTLELPWKNNSPKISSIPDGEYKAVLRYDHSDRWRIELISVPGDRKNIQIHVGNYTDDTHGCVLIGRKIGGDLCSVIDSKGAYEDFRYSFYGSKDPVKSPDLNILVSFI